MKNFTKLISIICLALLLVTGLKNPSTAHDGVVHKNMDEALQHQQETTPNTLGFPDIKGGDFRLVDHNGNERTSNDPDGNHQLIFFGYANCKAICTVALPRMVEAVSNLDREEILITPVLITVDPERDTVENMKQPMLAYHDRMVGLTGSASALQQAYDAFKVEKSLIYEHPEEGPIYAHGSFIYLLGPNGDLKTLFPPILGPDRIAEVAKGYILGETH
ncbi:MAG: SCO family protein [Pseudomonadota bacterium]